MSAGDDVEIRRARLRALRERYQQAPLEPAVVHEPPARASAERLPVPVGRRAGAAKQRSGRPAAGGLLQRVAAFLSQEGPGAQFVSGTLVREDRLGQVVQFLKRRGAADNHQAQRARGILSYLTDCAPGERAVAGVSIARAVALLERAGGRQPPDGGLTGFAGDPGIIEGDVVAIEPPPDRQGDETDKVMDLVGRARRLSEELLAVHQQIAQRLEDRGEALPSAAGGRAGVKAGRSAPMPATAPAKNSNEWYMDFLD